MSSLNGVRSAARMLATARADAAEAEAFLHHQIRTALAGGESAAAIAEVAGVSRARVYQIRDGRR